MNNFAQQNTTFQADNSKRVISMTITLKIKDCTGGVAVTDIMLQRGKVSSEWSGHPSEIKWTNNG